MTLPPDLRLAIREQEQELVYVLASLEARRRGLSAVEYADAVSARDRLRRLGFDRGWPRLELAPGIALMGGEVAWAAFLRRGDARRVQLALAAMGAVDPPPPLQAARPAPVRGALPCPRCGNVAFSLSLEDGRRRRCDGPLGCGHTWRPDDAVEDLEPPREQPPWA